MIKLRKIRDVLMCPFKIAFEDYRVYGMKKQFRLWFLFLYFSSDY